MLTIENVQDVFKSQTDRMVYTSKLLALVYDLDSVNIIETHSDKIDDFVGKLNSQGNYKAYFPKFEDSTLPMFVEETRISEIEASINFWSHRDKYDCWCGGLPACAKSFD